MASVSPWVGLCAVSAQVQDTGGISIRTNGIDGSHMERFPIAQVVVDNMLTIIQAVAMSSTGLERLKIRRF